MYTTISEFGEINEIYNDPATYCVLDGLDSQFMHGSIGFQKGNFKCSEYMSNRCSAKWDDLCETFADTKTKKFPRSQYCSSFDLTDGHTFLRETAFKKYLLKTSNCYYSCEPFDPTVANSPLVCFETETAGSVGPTPAAQWSIDGKVVYEGCQIPDNPSCQKIYGFTDDQMYSLDSDPVMNRLLTNPNIALDLLDILIKWTSCTENWNKIYNTRFHLFSKAYST